MGEARYRWDELRHLASALLQAVGLSPVRASALATHLLWHDAAGLPGHGMASLAAWVERIEARAVDPSAEGRVTGETTGTTLFDGENGVPPLLLARAAELSVEKAREAGVGLTRVQRVGRMGPVAAIAGELAVGPYFGAVVGHEGAWALALPSGGGLPAIFDASLAAAALPSGVAWARPLVPEGGWLVAAVAVGALEPFGTFQERMEQWLSERKDSPGALWPAAWEDHRRTARECGIAVAPAVWERLAPWIERAGAAVPEGRATPHS